MLLRGQRTGGRGRKRLDLDVDPPPDLAIEVDISSSSLDKLAIYASLGVPEVWVYDGSKLQVHQLQPDGAYARQTRQPGVSAAAAGGGRALSRAARRNRRDNLDPLVSGVRHDIAGTRSRMPCNPNRWWSTWLGSKPTPQSRTSIEMRSPVWTSATRIRSLRLWRQAFCSDSWTMRKIAFSSGGAAAGRRSRHARTRFPARRRCRCSQTRYSIASTIPDSSRIGGRSPLISRRVSSMAWRSNSAAESKLFQASAESRPSVSRNAWRRYRCR